MSTPKTVYVCQNIDDSVTSVSFIRIVGVLLREQGDSSARWMVMVKDR